MTVEILVADLWDYEGYQQNEKTIVNLAHGINCAGAMGAGIAIEFKERFPQLYEEYKTMCSKDLINPGDCWVWSVESPDKQINIFNLAIKSHWRMSANYKDVSKSFIKMKTAAEQMQLAEIAMPFVGAGLGGIPKQNITKLINEIFADKELQIKVFDKR